MLKEEKVTLKCPSGFVIATNDYITKNPDDPNFNDY
jgi:hypothetical protein